MNRTDSSNSNKPRCFILSSGGHYRGIDEKKLDAALGQHGSTISDIEMLYFEGVSKKSNSILSFFRCPLFVILNVPYKLSLRFFALFHGGGDKESMKVIAARKKIAYNEFIELSIFDLFDFKLTILDYFMLMLFVVGISRILILDFSVLPGIFLFNLLYFYAIAVHLTPSKRENVIVKNVVDSINSNQIRVSALLIGSEHLKLIQKRFNEYDDSIEYIKIENIQV